MKKAFKFIESLPSSFYEVLGYPTIKIYSDSAEVYFDCTSIIKDLEVFEIKGYDELRFFPKNDSIVFVYTFYDFEDE